jgi:hypothetical protein
VDRPLNPGRGWPAARRTARRPARRARWRSPRSWAGGAASRRGSSARPAMRARPAGLTTCATRAAACSRPAASSTTRLAAGTFPALLASDCSVCLTTLPALLRHEPSAAVLWLDAHGDFNTPDDHAVGLPGGMCLAGACGLWDTGFDGPRLDPAQVVMCGVRATSTGPSACSWRPQGVGTVAAPVGARRAAGRPARLRAPGPRRARPERCCPPSSRARRPVGRRPAHPLAEVAGAAEVVGCEITALAAPARARRVATIVDPLIPEALPEPAAPLVEDLTSAAPQRAWAAGGEDRHASTRRASSPRASGSPCSSTRARSPSSASTPASTTRSAAWRAATRPPTA